MVWKEKLFICFAGFQCVKFTRAGGTVADRLSPHIFISFCGHIFEVKCPTLGYQQPRDNYYIGKIPPNLFGILLSGGCSKVSIRSDFSYVFVLGAYVCEYRFAIFSTSSTVLVNYSPLPQAVHEINREFRY